MKFDSSPAILLLRCIFCGRGRLVNMQWVSAAHLFGGAAGPRHHRADTGERIRFPNRKRPAHGSSATSPEAHPQQQLVHDGVINNPRSLVHDSWTARGRRFLRVHHTRSFLRGFQQGDNPSIKSRSLRHDLDRSAGPFSTSPGGDWGPNRRSIR